MSKAVTVRLDDADHAELERQAQHLRVRPGTLARILVHSGLSGPEPALGRQAARNALDRLVARSQRQPAADALSLLNEARAGLEPPR